MLLFMPEQPPYHEKHQPTRKEKHRISPFTPPNLLAAVSSFSGIQSPFCISRRLEKMYKTKLQELCHQRRWALPTYFTVKDGLAHDPRFKASVLVNSHPFDSPASCKSAKQAQNDAAKLAFFHFTSPSSSPLISTTETEMQDENTEGKGQAPNVQSQALGVKDDTLSQYKSLLQNYAHRKKFDLPLYSSTNEGPSHACRFKATVTVDGHTFESPGFFRTLKEAEHAAAKAALTSLPPDCFEEENCCFYKILLQELAQREDCALPVYKTLKSGLPHMPTFFSSVEVEGETFYGKAGKSKKEAERNAAKVAYTVIKQRAMNRSGKSASDHEPEEIVKSTFGLDMNADTDLQQNMEKNGKFVSSPAAKHEEDSAESENNSIFQVHYMFPALLCRFRKPLQVAVRLESNGLIGGIMLTDASEKVNLAENLLTSIKIGCEESVPLSVVHVMDRVAGNEVSSHQSELLPILSKEVPSTSPALTRSGSPTSIPDSCTRKTSEPRSYLLCNRVRVYTSYPNIAIPRDITVLPIGDERWVAVSLEFPNEKCY